MSTLSGTGGAIYITGGRKVVTSASWSLSFRTDDELGYGQVRVISPHVALLVLAPGPLDTWDTMILNSGDSQWRPTGDIRPMTGEFLRDLPLVEP